eukprot:gene19903-biopygen13058
MTWECCQYEVGMRLPVHQSVSCQSPVSHLSGRGRDEAGMRGRDSVTIKNGVMWGGWDEVAMRCTP